ncbi:hypothetical protein HDU97_004357 [Phlyctochytrium planicorne]|nr:hypothetical protein HDU97_004357 [Phlyctochytrium planicorne]
MHASNEEKTEPGESQNHILESEPLGGPGSDVNGKLSMLQSIQRFASKYSMWIMAAIVALIAIILIGIPVSFTSGRNAGSSSCRENQTPQFPSALTNFTPSNPAPVSASVPPAGASKFLWPIPLKASYATDAAPIAVDPLAISFQIVGSVKSARLQRAFDRFGSKYKKVGCGVAAGAKPLIVEVKLDTGDEVAIATAPETYTLEVPAAGNVVIGAANTVGALRALETFSQLLVPNTIVPAYVFDSIGCDIILKNKDYKPGYYLPGAPWSISDGPSFSHRGLLMDTARHYVPVEAILRTIEGLAASKLNVLHWHIVDSQSFPVVSETVPTLSAGGAYSSFQVYNRADVQRIVTFAEDRGVRVVPEFDLPGHTYAWGIANPGLTVCNAAKDWKKYCAEPPCGQIDVTKKENVDLVATLLKEMSTWFKDPLFHLGTDEVNEKCYTDDPNVSSYLSRTGKNVNTLVSDFLLPLHQVLDSSGKVPMHWEEAILTHKAPFDKSTVIQTWANPEEAIKILQQGYRIVKSDSSAYYLDCGAGDWLEAGGTSWCDPYKSWQKVYKYDILKGVPEDLKKNVLGGEVALWAEQTEAHNMDMKLWPRAAAAAESWWSFKDSTGKNLSDANARLTIHADRLVSLGIASSPLQPQWCRNGGCA